MRARRIPLFIALALLLVAAGAYWFATGGVPEGGAPEWVTARPIAHRGLHTGDAVRPEDSMAAFRAAVASGYPIELDVQLTKDRRLAVLHDYTLERISGGADERAVADVTLAELQRIGLFGAEEHAPALGDVLTEVDGRVPIFVEVKNEGAVGQLEDVVAEVLSAYDGEVAVISFNPFSLARIAERAPGVPRGQVASRFKGEDLAWYKKSLLSRFLMNWSSKPAFVAYDLDDLPTLGVRLQRLRGRPVIAWTASDPADMERAYEVADQVEFDPGALR